MEIFIILLGILAMLLVFGLLALFVMEYLTSALNLRGRNLERALRNLLTDDFDDRVFDAFRDSPLYRQLATRKGRRRVAPSYLSDESFWAILYNIILEGEEAWRLEEKIEDLESRDLRQVLRHFLRDAQHDLVLFEMNVKNWYNEHIDRAASVFKRYTQRILMLVGLSIAVIFNFDVIQIFEVSSDRSVGMTGMLGWGAFDFSQMTVYDWLVKIFGWLISAGGISLTAPFLFDILKKITRIRLDGSRPVVSTYALPIADPGPAAVSHPNFDDSHQASPIPSNSHKKVLSDNPAKLNEIRKLVGEDKLKEALAQLESYFLDQNDNECLNHLTLFRNNLSTVEKEFKINIIGTEARSVRRSRICAGLLSWLSK